MANCNVTRAQRRWLTVEAAKQDPSEKKLRERAIANNAAASFISMIPGVRAWFRPAFPVVGLAAFAGFLSEAEAKRLRDFIEEAEVPTRANTRRAARLVEAHDLVWRAKAIVDEVKDELGIEGPDFGSVNEGIAVLTYKAVTGDDFPL